MARGGNHPVILSGHNPAWLLKQSCAVAMRARAIHPSCVTPLETATQRPASFAPRAARACIAHALFFSARNATTTRLRSYGMGVTVPVQAVNFYAQAARIDNRYDNNGSTLKNDDATFIGLGANYSFSKRTDVCASRPPWPCAGAARW